MGKQNQVEGLVAAPLNGLPSILASACRLLVFVIPSLIRLGLIDHSGCVVLGAVIGIVIALRSMKFGPD